MIREKKFEKKLNLRVNPVLAKPSHNHTMSLCPPRTSIRAQHAHSIYPLSIWVLSKLYLVFIPWATPLLPKQINHTVTQHETAFQYTSTKKTPSIISWKCSKKNRYNKNQFNRKHIVNLGLSVKKRQLVKVGSMFMRMEWSGTIKSQKRFGGAFMKTSKPNTLTQHTRRVLSIGKWLKLLTTLGSDAAT